MVWQVTRATVALAIAATVSTGVLAYVLPAAQDNWRRLKYRAFVWLSLGAIVWTATYGIHLAATTGAAQYVLLDLTWVGIAIVTATWPVFAFSVTGSDALTGRSILLLVAVPTVVARMRDPAVVVGEDGRVLDFNDADDDRLGFDDGDLNRPASAVFAGVLGVERALEGDECGGIELVGPSTDRTGE